MPILTLDAREYSEEDKNRVIIQAFDSLELGERMVVINNNDPSHILNQIDKDRPGKVEWEPILEGPEQWETAVSKRYLNYIYPK